jgi:PTS system nitrogen regulatory IIA component
MMTDREIMTIDEVAEYLRVSERTVYDWAQKEILPGGKLGTSWRFRRSDIERWVDQRLGDPEAGTPKPTVSIETVLAPERCMLLDCTTKQEALDALADVLATAPQVRDPAHLKKALATREKLMSTGIGMGIGLPHVRISSVRDIVMAFGVNDRDLTDYESINDTPVRLIAMIAAHDDQHADYIRLLSHLSTRLKDSAVREQLLRAGMPEEIYEALASPL